MALHNQTTKRLRSKTFFKRIFYIIGVILFVNPRDRGIVMAMWSFYKPLAICLFFLFDYETLTITSNRYALFTASVFGLIAFLNRFFTISLADIYRVTPDNAETDLSEATKTPLIFIGLVCLIPPLLLMTKLK